MRAWALTLMLAVLGSCRSSETGPYAPVAESQRRTAAAESLSRQAAELIPSDPEKAEELLRAALTEDIFFGPAHNNLGVLHLKRGELYEAANEFEWARKLMPGHPDPRVNLALTLERAGQSDEAIATYSAALEVYPEFLPAVQGLASLLLRTDREDERLGHWLELIALRSRSQEWKEWAKRQLTLQR